MGLPGLSMSCLTFEPGSSGLLDEVRESKRLLGFSSPKPERMKPSYPTAPFVKRKTEGFLNVMYEILVIFIRHHDEMLRVACTPPLWRLTDTACPTRHPEGGNPRLVNAMVACALAWLAFFGAIVAVDEAGPLLTEGQ